MRVVLTGEKPLELEGHRRQIQGIGLDCSGSDCVSFETLSHRLAQAPAPGMVLVFSGKDAEPALAAVKQAATMAGSPVWGVASPGSELKQMFEKAGVQGVVDPDRLEEGLSHMLAQGGGAMSSARGQVFGVMSAHPGCGVTTIAANLAFACAVKQPAKVALMEAGYTVPELALHLDLTVQHSFAELVRNWDRMDAHMLRQMAIPHPRGVNIFAYAAATLAPVVVEPAVLQRLLALARGLYDTTILDLAHGLPAVTRSALPLMEKTLIVFRPDVPSLRLTKELLKQLQTADVKMDRLQLVANRTGWRQQVDSREIEKMLNLPVQEWIPDEPATVIAALNEGKPLVEYSSRAKITRSIDRLAVALLSRK